jgi:hypothetical protein
MYGPASSAPRPAGERRTTVSFCVFLTSSQSLSLFLFLSLSLSVSLSLSLSLSLVAKCLVEPIKDLHLLIFLQVTLFPYLFLTLTDMKMMFEPRPPLPFQPPLVKRKMPRYTGIGQFVNEFELVTPPIIPVELPKDRKARIREQLLKANAEKNDLLVADWDPHKNYKATE